jgi:hypothetical protein
MPDTGLLETYRSNRQKTDVEFFKMVNNPFYFELYKIGKLPMGFIAGLKVKSCDATQCSITVPFRWMNQNPFRSTYFAVLSMAAEMSTGMLALMATYKSQPSVSMLVTRTEGDFTKKAVGLTTFTCKQGAEIVQCVEQAISSGEPQVFNALTIGTSASGETEARFVIQWGFKARVK